MRVTAGALLFIIANPLAQIVIAGPTSPCLPVHTSGSPLEIRRPLNTSAAVLFDLIRLGYNSIPLAVLNQTKCVALVNSKGVQNAVGIASCRLTPNEWTGPVFLSYHNNDRVKASGERQLLVLIMSDKSVRSMLSGKASFGGADKSQPGPLLPRQAQLREEDINADAFIYSRDPLRKLKPATIDGSLAIDQEMTRILYSRKVGALEVLTGRVDPPNSAREFVTAVGSFFNMITPAGIVIHHSSALPTYGRVPKDERQVDRFHAKRGFAVACSGRLYHVAYHYFILPNGRVKPGRPENCQGAHAHGYNAYLGISLAGDFSGADNPDGAKGLMRPTNAQMKSLQRLCRNIMRKYNIPPKNVLRHSDVSNTRCPGDRFPYAELMTVLAHQVAPTPQRPDQPEP